MKRTYTTLILLLLIISCRAQTIVPMKQADGSSPDNVYFKDTDNFLDNFVGTWKYQNGSEEFTLMLKKKLFYDYGGSYDDILYGEYKYVNPSGNTLINTLTNIDLSMNESYHAISGARLIRKNQYYKCSDCSQDEFRVKSFFDDPGREYITMDIIFRYINSTTIKARIHKIGVAIINENQVTLPQYPQIPLGEYTLTKQ